MSDRMAAGSTSGFQAVEFLDIPPMDETLTDPPRPHRTRVGQATGRPHAPHATPS